ncbi:hypothetical protein F0252_21445, partial [Vibrio hepatarius]|nr:hypothetical protein [Vibrio hepatarius]
MNFHNKAFKSDSQRLAFSLRSSIAKRRSHLNAALCVRRRNGVHIIYCCVFINCSFFRSLLPWR